MELWPMQQELVDKLGVSSLTGRLIGDQMGIGKTAEAIGIDLALRRGLPGFRRTLIVAPRSTHLDPWAKTIEGLTGKKTCVIDRKNRAAFVREATNGSKYEYYVCHYEAMRLMPQLINVSWAHVILDECHRIKNAKAQQTLAIKRLKPLFKTAMSGTPADDKPDDLWSTLDFLYPNKWGSKRQFSLRYCEVTKEETIIKGKGGVPRTLHYEKVNGLKLLQDGSGRVDPGPVAELHRRLEPFYIRRLKKDVLKDLPDKYYTRITVDLLPEQRKVYNDLRSKMLAWIGQHENERLQVTVVIAQLIRLQQAALGYLEFGENDRVRITEPSAKLDELVSLIEDESPLPFVGFSQSKSMTNLAADRLRREGLKVAIYTGDTPDTDRALAIEGFQSGAYDAFLGTIAAGGEGITLTRSSTVIFFDRTWNPSKNQQAEDRLHRAGQKNAVQVIDFFARDTVDDRVQNTNINKWSAIREILGDNR
jgi:SNF2 family DNA or RNA helicase